MRECTYHFNEGPNLLLQLLRPRPIQLYDQGLLWAALRDFRPRSLTGARWKFPDYVLMYDIPLKIRVIFVVIGQYAFTKYVRRMRTVRTFLFVQIDRKILPTPA